MGGSAVFWKSGPVSKKVFPRAALHRLQATGIVGRDDELSVVADSLEVLSQAQSRFLVFEGPPGSGKTTLLDTIRDNLTVDDAYVIIKVWGDQQEAYRPYYMLQRILVALLNQREDKGSATLEGLTDVEMSHLAHVIPQLKPEDASEAKEQPDSQKRQAIFATLVRFLPRLVDYRPLLLLVDDLQFADEATLLLLRVLMERNELTLFVCGTAMESIHVGEVSPLDRFLNTEDDLDIRRARLQPLSADHIAEYLGSRVISTPMPSLS